MRLTVGAAGVSVLISGFYSPAEESPLESDDVPVESSELVESVKSGSVVLPSVVLLPESSVLDASMSATKSTISGLAY